MPWEKFTTFYIESFEFNDESLVLSLNYSFDKKVPFIEEIDFKAKWLRVRNEIEKNIIENLCFQILIAFGISYYKLNPTQKIVVETGNLDDIQKIFWRKFYINGLGEFFFKNNIDFISLCFFETTSATIYQRQKIKLQERYLVPIGWGKDSIVTTILLKERGIDAISPFIFWKSDKIKNDFLASYWKKELLITRKLSPNLFEMNHAWYLNGHIPITWLISFVLLLCSYMYDYKYIVFSNEKSANIWNTEFFWNEINHQYSKSEEFERDFQNYLNNYITPSIVYFSALREYSELEIARIFADKWKPYFKVFSSCNTNFKITWSAQQKRWCNKCPKCLFVYAILRPFLSEKEVKSIWGKELFDDASLENLYKEIIGLSWFKPFECVGEREEAQLASILSGEKFQKLPYLLKKFHSEISKFDVTGLKNSYLKRKM